MESIFVHPEPRKLLQVGLLCLGLLFMPGVGTQAARAQQAAQPTEAEIEAARALFAEGLALSDASEWEAAAAIFHEVLAVVSSPPVLFNLAHALVGAQPVRRSR
jgi:DNA-binding GntR family transcriptional regulator